MSRGSIIGILRCDLIVSSFDGEFPFYLISAFRIVVISYSLVRFGIIISHFRGKTHRNTV